MNSERRGKSNVILFPISRKAPDCDAQVERARKELTEPEPPPADEREIEWVRSLLADFRNRHHRESG